MAAKRNKGKNKRQNRWLDRNYGARIRTEETATGGLRTKTAGRDYDSLNVTFVTRPNGPAYFRIAGKEYVVNLSGRNARTIYRVLQKHFDELS